MSSDSAQTPTGLTRVYNSFIWAIVAAFGAYFCMYGFRKPFTVGVYANEYLCGIGYKTVLVVSQTIGYALSKFIGIKVVSEIRHNQRALLLVLYIGFAQLMLLFFGLVPAPWNFVLLFFNGLPLGMIFGIIQGYLEGRKMTEALVAGLCTSFIVADGFTKSVGSYLLKNGISDYWMPFSAGLIFSIPLAIFIWMLTKIPLPSVEDTEHRSERHPMTATERKAIFKKYAPGMLSLGLAYLLVTLLRSMRADFAPEIWADLGYKGIPAVFTQSELFVAFGVMLINGLVVLISSNRQAFYTGIVLSIAGFILVLISIAGLKMGLDGFWYMVGIGLGFYVPYVAIHTTLFERLLAMTRDKGNVGYFMYFVDTMGYFGYCALLFLKNSLQQKSEFLNFYNFSGVGFAILGILAIGYSGWYFKRFAK
jgi:hypothetical protein